MSRFRVFWLQTSALTVANLKTRYRHTFAGFLWVLLNPMILYGTQSYVFHTVLKLQVDRYPMFLLSGLLPWVFIVQSTEMCTGMLVNSSRLLKSFPIHPFVFLASQLLDNLVNFFAAFMILLIPTLLQLQINPISIVLLPLPLFTLFMGVFGIAWFLSTLNVFFRDTRFIISFVIQILFYLTPIFYPEGFVPEKYLWMVEVNPIYLLIKPFRSSLYNFDIGIFVHDMTKAFGVSAAFCGLAFLYWKRNRNEVYHLL